jgi:antitoxin PrlF
MATVTSKGQITIPKPVRQALGLAPGSKVDFVLEDGHAVLRKRPPTEALKRWEGYLRGKLPGRTVDETMEMLRGERLADEPERQ